MKSHYEFIVYGSGSAGSVVARRLAETPDVTVLLLEPDGNDDVPSVMDAKQWASDLASVWDWDFEAQPNPHLNGRVVSMSMGKVLRGGSSINAMAWARGRQNDWDYFAAEAGDSAWNYEAVVDGNLKVYGIQNLRIADASIMPRVATGNTMAPLRHQSSSANERERSCGGYISL